MSADFERILLWSDERPRKHVAETRILEFSLDPRETIAMVCRWTVLAKRAFEEELMVRCRVSPAEQVCGKLQWWLA
jgi:hypothetical protein